MFLLCSCNYLIPCPLICTVVYLSTCLYIYRTHVSDVHSPRDADHLDTDICDYKQEQIRRRERKRISRRNNKIDDDADSDTPIALLKNEVQNAVELRVKENTERVQIINSGMII